MPDILQLLVIYILLAALIVFILIKIGPSLFAGSKPTPDKDDDDQDICIHCGYDVRTLLRCPECGQPTREARRRKLLKLREQWPTETIAPRLPEADEQPVLILTTDDVFAGRLLCEHLEARGIKANLNEVKGVSLAAYTTARDSYRLTVWTNDKERAEAIVEHLWPAEMRARG
jgi:hypothetical protein